jgi:hypothetical protein
MWDNRSGLFRPENHLCATKQCDFLTGCGVAHNSIPNLRIAPEVLGSGSTQNDFAFTAHGAQVVALEFDGCKG